MPPSDAHWAKGHADARHHRRGAEQRAHAALRELLARQRHVERHDPAAGGAIRDRCLCLHAHRAARGLARRFDHALKPLERTLSQSPHARSHAR
jgi:hypothetical protein